MKTCMLPYRRPICVSKTRLEMVTVTWQRQAVLCCSPDSASCDRECWWGLLGIHTSQTGCTLKQTNKHTSLTQEGRKQMFYLTMHSTHFILWFYGIGHMRKDYSDSERGIWLTARVLLYAPSHRLDSTYHGLYYTSCGALAGTRNSLTQM